MNSEEIRTKASELAAFYTAKANGKILQYDTKAVGWVDSGSTSGPDMQSDLTRWRVKPEPRRMWQVEYTKAETDSSDTAKKWKAAGYTVTEWVEVLPE